MRPPRAALSPGALPSLSAAQEEEARDLLARAQAGLLDEHPVGARRSLRRLHGLLVPVLDHALPDVADLGADEAALSAGIGLVGLYRDLPDVDVERERPLDLLLHHAARADGVPGDLDGAAFAPLHGNDESAVETQWQAIDVLLAAEPLPRSRWWRRLTRGAAGPLGPLGDRARVQVVRGAAIVLDRPPPEAEGEGEVAQPGPAGPAEVDHTDLGALRAGDRMTLQVPMPLPGRIAVFHAVGDEHEAELSLVLPGLAGEDALRRAYEVVEVVGELAAVPGTTKHGMVVVWAPELLPPGWVQRVLRERRLPPDARAWLYRYRLADDKPGEIDS